MNSIDRKKRTTNIRIGNSRTDVHFISFLFFGHLAFGQKEFLSHLSANFVAKVLWGDHACATIQLHFRLPLSVTQR